MKMDRYSEMASDFFWGAEFSLKNEDRSISKKDNQEKKFCKIDFVWWDK